MARRVASPIFIGRRAELERVAEGLRAAGGGRPAAFLVTGEAGVGKTRFAEECAERARAAGFRVLAGSCIELAEGSLPYAPVVQALRGLPGEISPSELDALLGAGRSELVRLMPSLGEAELQAAETGASAQGRLFELLLGFLVRLSAERPLLCIVEDLHWADRSTLDLVTFAVRAFRQGAIVLLATYRSDELHRRHPLLPILAELERSGRVDRLELARFDRAELEAQLAAILSSAPDADISERIWTRSGGNAFYAEELLAAGAAEGRLPDSLREVLLARVASLSEPTQELLRVASAGGVRISGALLAAVTVTAETDLLPALREAVSRQILVASSDLDDGTYGFRHALVQEALYGEVLPGERAGLHAAYARALEELADPAEPTVAAQLAHHWFAAHDLSRALESSVAAGLAAERTYAFAEAQAQFERALELWDSVSDAGAVSSLDRVSLLERAAQAADSVGTPARAAAHIRTALTLIDPAVDPIRAGLLYGRLGRFSWNAADRAAALVACREAVRLVPAEPPSAERARVLAYLGYYLHIASRTREAAPLCDEAVAMAGLVGARDVEAEALLRRASVRGSSGDGDGAIADSMRAREIALESGAVETVLAAYVAAARALVWLSDRWEEAEAIASEAIAYAEGHGLVRTWGSGMLSGTAYGLYLLGRWEQAERTLKRALLLGAETEARPFMYLYSRIELDIGLGRLAEASALVERLEQIADDEGPAGIVWLARRKAELAIAQDDPRRARETVADVVAAIGALGEDLYETGEVGALYALGVRAEADIAVLARAHARDREVDEARAIANDLVARMRALKERIERALPAVTPRAAAYLALCEAEVARLEGSSSSSRWAAVAGAWEALRMPYPRAYARYREGAARLREGSRAASGPPLREAHAICMTLGATPLCREIEALADRGGIELDTLAMREAPPAPPSDPYGLTPREREVLVLVAAGRTNRQIGEVLFITEKTASVHVSNILGKLGVAGRTEAAMLAQRLGLLDRVPS